MDSMKNKYYKIFYEHTSSSADGRATVTRVREIHGLDIDVDNFGATSELTFFSNEVRLHGVRVG